MHNLQLSDEQQMIAETVRRLAQDELQAQALHHDEHREFARQSFGKLAELGLLGLPIPEAAGGAGMGQLAFAIALEELAQACGSTARLLLAQTGLCAQALADVAAGRKALAALIAGQQLGAFVGPDSGMRAQSAGNGWQLRGECQHATAAAVADLLVVFARLTDGQLALFCATADVAQRAPVLASGFRASAPGSLRLLDAALPASGLLARGEAAEAAWRRVLLGACIGGAALAVGLATAAFEASRRHSKDRIAFGKPLLAQQAVQHKLAEVWRRTQAARHLTWHAARLADAGEDALRPAMAARLEALQAAVRAGDEGIQIHGGYGYTVEYHVERHYRDSQTLAVLDVSPETLLDRIAQQVAT
jgi:alkylation response protein AidB-like acyl-CoA dehydrogenase